MSEAGGDSDHRHDCLSTSSINSPSDPIVASSGMICDLPAPVDDASDTEVQISDEQFRLLVDGINEYAVFMLDTAGNVVSWNRGAARIKGYSAEEIIGRHFSCFYPVEDIDAGKPQAELEIAISRGRYEEEGPRIRKGGEVFWASVVISPLRDKSGALRGFAKVTRDISNRRQVEEKTRLMVELALNAVILVNSEGTLLMANPRTELLFGYTQSELIGQSVDMLVPEEMRSQHPALRQKYFSNPSLRQMGVGRELNGRRKDGSLFPVEIGLYPMELGKEPLVLVSVIDITERKRLEDSARQRLTELAHAGRLLTIGEMFSCLAHEINQPLVAAANYARACIRYVKSDVEISKERMVDLMEKAANQSERATQIVKRLGNFMKKDRAERTELDFNTLIENVIRLISVMTAAEVFDAIRIRLDLPDRSPRVFADKLQIEQVLINIIRNSIEALQANPEGQRQITINARECGELLKVEITDNGPGISRENLPKVLHSFFTTKESGMGLGLSLSRSIIEAHGGKMEVTSEEHSGTTVSFTLFMANWRATL